MDNATDHSKVFRAEKTTANRDDFKVLMIGTMIGILMLLLFPVIQTVYDENFAERPFVTATVQVTKVAAYQKPMVLYDADATQTIKATWIAVIEDEQGNRLATRRGQGDYTSKEDNPRLWTWESFFDTELGSPPPFVPVQPFRICIRYVSMTLDTNIVDESPEFCSKMFFPGLEDLQTSESEGL